MVQLILNQCNGEEDPPLLFEWKLNAMVSAINNPSFIPQANPPFPLVVPVTSDALEELILTHIRRTYVMPFVGHVAIPCSQHELCDVAGNAGRLCNDPWFISVNNFSPVIPIARLYITASYLPNVVRVCDSLPGANGIALWSD